MALTRRQVENIANLARLEITEEEIPAFVENLSGIIDLVDQLNAAQTDHVEPMAHPSNRDCTWSRRSSNEQASGLNR
jgi:aspartyl-tRNA(Asn)/glutamyl-tRNA(Gln) amidotransferase subunit C